MPAPEAAVLDLLDGAHDMAGTFAALAGPLYGGLEVLTGLSVEHPELEEALVNYSGELISFLRPAMVAFGAVCRERIGLPPDLVLGAFFSTLAERWRTFEKSLELDRPNVEEDVDPDLLDQHRQVFEEIWGQWSARWS